MRDRAAAHLAAAWADEMEKGTAFPVESLRHGPGPRSGSVTTRSHGCMWWASSLAHAEPSGAVVTSLLLQDHESTALHGRMTIGVDVESVARHVHPGVARLIRSDHAADVQTLTGTGIPLMATICAKEAMYKADTLQAGRSLADYALLSVKPFGADGWIKTGIARGEAIPRFRISVLAVDGHWLAVALATD